MNTDRGARRLLGGLALAGAVALGGCAGDEDRIVAPDPTPSPGGALFARYVALGNSITAGVQSGGLNDSLQLRAYPNLVAQQAGAIFELPLFRRPGCPPPFSEPLSNPIGPETCSAPRIVEPRPRVIQNLAVPGAAIADALNLPPGQLGAINAFVLGSGTQVEAMVAAQPSLVSAWLGNNDALAAARAGNPALLTDEAAFTASLDELVDGINQTPAAGAAVLIGVVSTEVIPILQPGVYFWLSQDAQGRFQGKPVHPSCAPVGPTGQPNPAAFNLVSFEMVGSPAHPEIHCSNDHSPGSGVAPGTFVMTPQERAVIGARVAAYNAALQQRAAANGWIYLDPNELLALYANRQDAQGRFQWLRRCQALTPEVLGTGDPQLIQGALVTSCPVPPTGPTAPFAAPNFFGRLISLDGIHPSTEAHRLVANHMIGALNQAHGLNIPLLPTD